MEWVCGLTGNPESNDCGSFGLDRFLGSQQLSDSNIASDTESERNLSNKRFTTWLKAEVARYYGRRPLLSMLNIRLSETCGTRREKWRLIFYVKYFHHFDDVFARQLTSLIQVFTNFASRTMLFNTTAHRHSPWMWSLVCWTEWTELPNPPHSVTLEINNEN